MRLAATLTPGRGASRRAISLAGTMRGEGGRAVDIAILDISATGFLAELPEGASLDSGVRVRVAATGIGRQRAVVVRHEGRRHGFAFTQPLPPTVVAGLDPERCNVEPLFAPASVEIAAPERSSAASIAIAVVCGVSPWAAALILHFAT